MDDNSVNEVVSYPYEVQRSCLEFYFFWLLRKVLLVAFGLI